MNARYDGFSLLELLIALGLGSFILSAAYFLFFSERYSYLTQHALLQSQDIARTGVHLLRDRLRQAGGLGCSAWHANFPVYTQLRSIPEGVPTHSSQLVQIFQSYGHGWNPPLPPYLNNRVRDETDVLIIHQAYQEATNLVQSMATAEVSLLLPAFLNIEVGDTLMISDCEQADIFQVSRLSRQGDYWQVYHQPPYNQTSALSKAYSKESYVNILHNKAYYIGNTNRKYPNGEAIYALYEFGNQHNELVEGINQFKIEKISSRAIQFTLETELNSIKKEWPVVTTLRHAIYGG